MASYLITVTFAHDTVELHHEGSFKDCLKAAWTLCADRKTNPAKIAISKAGEIIEHEQDGWQTVSPIERVA